MRRNYIGRVQVVRRTNLGEGGSGRERSEGEKLGSEQETLRVHMCFSNACVHVLKSVIKTDLPLEILVLGQNLVACQQLEGE